MSKLTQFICGLFGASEKHMEKYNEKQLKEQLVRDEGVVYEIYLCPSGEPTFGVGHLVKEDDPEWGQPVGTPVSPERVWSAFDEDVEIAVQDASALFRDFWGLPPTVQEVLINMAFNLGYRGLAGFAKMRLHINNRRWRRAAMEGRDSRWYRQVTKRAERLMTRLENVGT
jgi:GH24 family phage-related lysozyme (muramidase)